ncbi:unnamed protein product [Tenebrio molitor]|nr:unnamed protein product [Tenebrio molitor]
MNFNFVDFSDSQYFWVQLWLCNVPHNSMKNHKNTEQNQLFQLTVQFFYPIKFTIHDQSCCKLYIFLINIYKHQNAPILRFSNFLFAMLPIDVTAVSKFYNDFFNKINIHKALQYKNFR